MDLLIADDDPASAQYLQLVLAKLGHAVTVAEDGAEAIALLRQFRFDAVLLDWEMPGADGPTVARWIREQGEAGDTPVYAVSAHEDLSSRPEYGEAGFIGYVMKPCSPQALAKLLQGAAGEREAGQLLVDETVFRSYAELLSGAGMDVAGAVGRILGGVREWLATAGEARELSKAQSMAGACAIVGAQSLSEALLRLTSGTAPGETQGAALRHAGEILDRTEAAMRTLLAG